MCSTSFAGKMYSHWNVFSDSCVYWKLVIVLELIVQCTSNKHERQNVEMKIRTGKCDGERSELYNFKQSWCLSPPPHLEDVGTELSPVDATTLLGKSLAWLQIIGFSSENGYGWRGSTVTRYWKANRCVTSSNIFVIAQNAKVLNFGLLQHLSCWNIWILGYLNIWISKYWIELVCSTLDIWIFEYLDIWIMNIWILNIGLGFQHLGEVETASLGARSTAGGHAHCEQSFD